MDFYSAYRHGFIRVAACTHRTVLADPAANAESVLRIARACHDDSVAVAVFPELTLSGYSIEDILLQDTLLDAVEDALLEVVAASADLLPVLVVGAPLRYLHRIYNTAVVIHRGVVLGVAPKSYLPTYREFYESRQVAAGDDLHGTIRIGGADVPFGPDLLFAAEDVSGLVLHVEICVHVPAAASGAEIEPMVNSTAAPAARRRIRRMIVSNRPFPRVIECGARCVDRSSSAHRPSVRRHGTDRERRRAGADNSHAASQVPLGFPAADHARCALRACGAAL